MQLHKAAWGHRRTGTIAAQLRVHHGTVARVLAQAGLPRIGQRPRPSRIDPYLPFIRQTLVDIDQVKIGQRAVIRLHAFDAGVLPEMAANVMRISPDSITDTRTNTQFYVVRIQVAKDELVPTIADA